MACKSFKQDQDTVSGVESRWTTMQLKSPFDLDKNALLLAAAGQHAAVPGRPDRHAHRVRPQLQAADAETGGAPGGAEKELRRADRARGQLEEQEIRHLGAIRPLGPLRILCPLRAYSKQAVEKRTSLAIFCCCCTADLHIDATQADMSCTTTALLFFFPLQEQVAQ